MTTAVMGALSAEQLAAYRRDGFVVARGLYSGETMLAWKQTMQAVLDEERKATGGAYLDEVGVRVWPAPELHPQLRAAMGDDRVTPILRQIVGPDVEFLSAKAVFKNNKTAFASPWHQDWFYWGGATKVSVWIALDDATVANGCLKFVPGSHVKVFPRKVVGGAGFVNQVTEEDLAGWPVETVEAKRGDAVFFHDLAVHSSHPNVSGADRWSLISTYRNAAVIDDCEAGVRGLWAKPMLVSGTSVNGGAGF